MFRNRSSRIIILKLSKILLTIYTLLAQWKRENLYFGRSVFILEMFFLFLVPDFIDFSEREKKYKCIKEKNGRRFLKFYPYCLFHLDLLFVRIISDRLRNNFEIMKKKNKYQLILRSRYVCVCLCDLLEKSQTCSHLLVTAKGYTYIYIYTPFSRCHTDTHTQNSYRMCVMRSDGKNHHPSGGDIICQ